MPAARGHTTAPASGPVNRPGRTPGQRQRAGHWVSRWLGPAWPRYAAGKLAGAAVSLVAVVFTGFFLFRLLPGDPVATMTYHHAVTPPETAALRHQLGLDRPVPAQFGSYVLRVIRGNLGDSFEYSKPVSSLILSHLAATVYLAGTATVLSAALGVWIGARSAWRSGSVADRVSTGAALALWSVPTFWLGLTLLIVFGAGVGPVPGIFPTGGISTPGVTGFFPVLLDGLRHLVLPCLTFTAVIYAQYVLLMRACLLDERDSGYVTTARAKGLRDALVLRRHAMPNALLPVVTLIFLNLGQVVASDVLVETVFSWPGLGTMFYEALEYPDFPLLEGLFIFFSACVIVMNLIADLLYPILDPRVRTA